MGCRLYLPNGGALDAIVRIGDEMKLWRCSENKEKWNKEICSIRTFVSEYFYPILTTSNSVLARFDRFWPFLCWTEVKTWQQWFRARRGLPLYTKQEFLFFCRFCRFSVLYSWWRSEVRPFRLGFERPFGRMGQAWTVEKGKFRLKIRQIMQQEEEEEEKNGTEEV